jgi:M6 family metalloprotease-like protein
MRLNKFWHGLLCGLLVAALFASVTGGQASAVTVAASVAQTSGVASQPAQAALRYAGTFYMISGGPQPYFYLYDDKGQNTELFIDPAVLAKAGGATALNRTRVQLDGKNLGLSRTLNGGSALEVTDIRLDVVPGSTPGKDANVRQAITGSRPFVTILCRFADSTGTTPKPVSYFEGLMSNTRPGLDHYFRENSLGAIDLVGSQIVGWFNLPQIRSYYYTDGQQAPQFQRMADDCTALADSVINFNDFQGINFVFNVNFGCCAWGGAIGMTLDSTSKAWPATWMPPGGLFQSIWAHELGHAFGMPHSANAIGQTYQNAWDVMSSDRFNSEADTDPTYGAVGQHAIAYHKDIPGWIPANRKFTQPGSGGTKTITLERLAQPGSTGYLMAKVPIPGSISKYYSIEARYRVGYDKKVANDAVIIHEVDPFRAPDDAWIVDPDGNANSYDAAAQWLPGEVFTDTANNIVIKVDSATPTGFVISIITPEINTTDLIVNDPAIDGNINVAGATEWYSFTAPTATFYTVETFNSGTLNDTVMKLYGPENIGVLVTQNDDIGGGNLMSKISKQYLSAGTYYVAVTAKSGTGTGAYSIQASAPLLVTRNNNDPAQLGSLSYAVGQATPGETVVLAPRNGNTINLMQSITVNQNISIRGECGRNGPIYTLNGAGAPGSTNGLVLNGRVILNGVKVTGFPGKQITAAPNRSQLSCVVASKFGSP